MKAFIVALLLLVSPTVASAQQSEEEMCLEQATVIFFVASGRDMGAKPKNTFNGLVRSGFSPELATALTKLVFGRANVAPDTLATQYLEVCISRATSEPS